MSQNKLNSLAPKPRKFWRLILPLFLCLLTLTTGCVQYDLGINFVSQTQGEIVQHIKLGERLTSFSQDIVKNWLNSIDQRVRQLQGHTKRKSDVEMTVVIPFNNGADLADKFNQFFNPADSENSPAIETNDLPQFNSHLEISQNNFLFFIRNRVNLELDLRSLSLLPDDNSFLIGSEALLDLEFHLNTPWGAKTLTAIAQDETDTPLPLETPSQFDPKQQMWQLKPGALNLIEVVFWVPSPIGIGALAIILLVAGGIALKYQLLPALGIGKRPTPPQQVSSSQVKI